MADIDKSTLERVTVASQAAAAASLAGGIIAASGRAHSLVEAMQVYQDVHFTMFPALGSSRFEAWKTTHNPNKKYE